MSAPSVAPLVVRLRAAGCVYAEEEAELLIASGATGADLDALVERRVGGEPLEQIVGWAQFGPVRVSVAPGVFVPRARTELLAREAAALAGRGSVVVDLCCGAGAIGAAVAAYRPGIRLYAADADPAAVACARRNLAPLGHQVYQGDLYAALPAELRGRIDVLVANVPYVPTEAIGLMPPEARLHEPRIALDGGPDGLDVLRRMAAQAPDWLAAEGHLLVETSERQAPVGIEILRHAGLPAQVVRDAELGATALIAERPG